VGRIQKVGGCAESDREELGCQRIAWVVHTESWPITPKLVSSERYWSQDSRERGVGRRPLLSPCSIRPTSGLAVSYAPKKARRRRGCGRRDPVVELK